jgi:hypothetical protein
MAEALVGAPVVAPLRERTPRIPRAVREAVDVAAKFILKIRRAVDDMGSRHLVA